MLPTDLKSIILSYLPVAGVDKFLLPASPLWPQVIQLKFNIPPNQFNQTNLTPNERALELAALTTSEISDAAISLVPPIASATTAAKQNQNNVYAQLQPCLQYYIHLYLDQCHWLTKQEHKWLVKLFSQLNLTQLSELTGTKSNGRYLQILTLLIHTGQTQKFIDAFTLYHPLSEIDFEDWIISLTSAATDTFNDDILWFLVDNDLFDQRNYDIDVDPSLTEQVIRNGRYYIDLPIHLAAIGDWDTLTPVIKEKRFNIHLANAALMTGQWNKVPDLLATATDTSLQSVQLLSHIEKDLWQPVPINWRETISLNLNVVMVTLLLACHFQQNDIVHALLTEFEVEVESVLHPSSRLNRDGMLPLIVPPNAELRQFLLDNEIMVKVNDVSWNRMSIYCPESIIFYADLICAVDQLGQLPLSAALAVQHMVSPDRIKWYLNNLSFRPTLDIANLQLFLSDLDMVDIADLWLLRKSMFLALSPDLQQQAQKLLPLIGTMQHQKLVNEPITLARADLNSVYPDAKIITLTKVAQKIGNREFALENGDDIDSDGESDDDRSENDDDDVVEWVDLVDDETEWVDLIDDETEWVDLIDDEI